MTPELALRGSTARPSTQESPSGEHECVRAGQCCAVWIDEEGHRRGNRVSRAGTFCMVCTRKVERVIGEFPRLYAHLETLLPRDRVASERVTGTRELPAPLRLEVASTQATIDTTLTAWATPVAIRMNVTWEPRLFARQRPGVRIGRAVALLAPNVALLLDLEPTPIPVWNAGPMLSMRTGVDAGLALLDLHRRASLLVTGGSGDARLPVPCQDCEGVLIRPNGMAHVECRGCEKSWPEDHYRLLCRILADDYRAVA